MTNTEHPTKTPSPRTGFFAALRALFVSEGTSAPSGAPAVNPVSQQAAAGKLTKRGSSRRVLRSLTLVPLLVFVSALAFSAAPALAAAPETPLLEAATYRTSTEAGLRGELNPAAAGETGTYEFLYKKSATECKGGSHTAPVTALGNQEEFVEGALTGLEPGGTYTVCLLAENEALPPETAESAPQTFTLPAETPATREVKEVTATTATFHGELNPLRTGTAGYEFMYNTANAGTCEGDVTTKLEAEQTGQGIAVSTKVTGLEPNTEYMFCVVAVNSIGELAIAPPQKPFKTGPVAPPKVDSESTSAVSSTAATLEAQVNPDEQETTYSFEYATNKALTQNEVTVAGRESLKAGLGDRSASVSTETLAPGTTYYYRVVATNATPPATDGTVQEFTTVPLPHGVKAETVTATTATFKGELTPLNEAVGTKYSFEYNVGAGCAGGPTTTQGEEPAGNGTGTGLVAEPVTGLEPNATYAVCLVASNVFGSETSASVSFKTLAAPPKIDAESNPALTPTEATFEAQVNPNNEATTAYLQYSTSPATSVNGSLSTSPIQVPAAPGKSLGSAYGDVGVSGETGKHLTPGTAYYYQAVAINATGTVYGTVETITAPVLEAPVIESETAPVVTPHEAQLETAVNPKYQETTCVFEYGPSSTLATGTKTEPCPANPLGSGGTAVPSSIILTGLTPKTTYYFRTSATNATETTKGTIDKFKTGTLEAPVIESESVSETEGVSSITQTTVTLDAQINPEYQKTQYEFEYAANTESKLFEHEGIKVAGGELPAGSIATGFEHSASASVTGLTPNTLYYYRVVAKNATGQAEQIPAVQSFTTSSVPIAATGGAQSVTATTATLPGTVTPDGLPTTYYVEYGQTTRYGEQAPFPVGEAGAGASPVGVVVPVGRLEPGTTYHYRIVATNINTAKCYEIGEAAVRTKCEEIFNATGTYRTPQTAYGQDQTFTTTASAPIITGLTATAVTQTTATISATLNPQVLPTDWTLQLGTSTGSLQSVTSGSVSSTTPLELAVGSLTPGTTYYYRLTATNTNGGIDPGGSFTTAAAPAASAPSSSLPAVIPFTSIAQYEAKEPKETIITTTGTKPLTKKQKLAKALKACHAKKGKKRAGCEATARKKYGSAKKKGKK